MGYEKGEVEGRMKKTIEYEGEEKWVSVYWNVWEWVMEGR